MHDEEVCPGFAWLCRHEADEQQGVGADDDGEHDAEEGELLHLPTSRSRVNTANRVSGQDTVDN